jgi:hypothetical protein
MTIDDLLRSILNPHPGGNQLAQAGAGYLPQTGLSPDMVARFHQMSGMGGPQAAPQASAAPQMAPSAAPMPQAAVAAPQAAPQGNAGGFLSRLFGGGQSDANPALNETAAWLEKQGYDPATAAALAGNKEAMQKILVGQVGSNKHERHTTTIDGKLVDTDTGQVVGDYAKPAEKVRLMTPDEVKSAGLPAGSYQQKPDGSIAQIGGGGSGVIEEYEYAKRQGFPGTLSDWEASKKGGMSLQVDPTTGEVTFQQGGNIKPLTEAQSKDTNFAVRAEGALPALEKYGTALTSLPESVGGSIPIVGNYFKSSDYQQAEQAGREFLTAILRKDSGAVIGKDELSSYGGMFLPQPGDSSQLLEQKKGSRARALAGLKAGMTPQAILAQEKALRGDNQGASPPVGISKNPNGGLIVTPPPDGTAAQPSSDGWKQVAPGLRIRKVN